ncbi:MAG: ferric iron uptake transcriptional regulator [Gammaproteobacteria bacterium]|nr:ferric iron uptake transcriptional regulator [Gammaproteobacteria bacterium]
MKSEDLKKMGLRATVPRMKILKLLEESEDHHLSAEDIHRTMLAANEDVGLATVYRVLAQFETAGIINRLSFDTTKAVYELDDSGHHDHLLCNTCGSVTEFVDPEIERLQKEIAKSHEFTINYHEMNIFGTCRACREKSVTD